MMPLSGQVLAFLYLCDLWSKLTELTAYHERCYDYNNPPCALCSIRHASRKHALKIIGAPHFYPQYPP